MNDTYISRINDIIYDITEGNQYACLALAREWTSEHFSEEEKKIALSILKSDADHGNPNCIYFLGLLEETGPDDLEKAVSFYEKAAFMDHADACFRLGLYYDNGYAGMENRNKALSYYETAAALGSTSACYLLGVFYLEGINVAPNDKEAVFYLKEASTASLGNYHLGLCYEYGRGVKKDIKRALSLYDDYLDDQGENDSICPISFLDEFYDAPLDAFLPDAHLAMGRCLLACPEYADSHFYPSISECFSTAYDTAEPGSETALWAAYHLGLCSLFAISKKADPKEGLSLIEEAAKGHLKKATDFLAEKKRTDAEISLLLEKNTVTTEDQQKEALLRLMLLEQKGLTKEAVELFRTKNLPVFGSDDVYGVCTFCQEEVNDYEMIKRFADQMEQQGNFVYYIHHSTGFGGSLANLFFVSSQPEEWQSDRTDLLYERPCVAVFNLRYDFMETGHIMYTIEQESIVRCI